MASPFEKYDLVKIEGIDRPLVVVSVGSFCGEYFVFCEDLETCETVTAAAESCIYQPIDQLNLFNKLNFTV
jgi:hypothetical protein